jgi:hypothetical protein
MNTFERGKELKQILGIGRNIFIQNLYDRFFKELKKICPHLLSCDTLLKFEENGYMEFRLECYTERGMNALDRGIRSLIYQKYRKKLIVIDDNYWDKFYTDDNMPEESIFYNEESIFVKFL